MDAHLNRTKRAPSPSLQPLHFTGFHLISIQCIRLRPRSLRILLSAPPFYDLWSLPCEAPEGLRSGLANRGRRLRLARAAERHPDSAANGLPDGLEEDIDRKGFEQKPHRSRSNLRQVLVAGIPAHEN